MDPFAKTPPPPYYAVIFTNHHRDLDDPEYDLMANEMAELAKTMPGYLGFEAARDENGLGFAVSYWESEEAIKNWKSEARHLEAQRRGRTDWYENYVVRVAKVERDYGISRELNEIGDETDD